MTRSLLSLLLALSLLTGCVTETVKSTSVPLLDAPDVAVPDAELLDVGVVILDPGISSVEDEEQVYPEVCLLYTSPSPRDGLLSRMPSSA